MSDDSSGSFGGEPTPSFTDGGDSPDSVTETTTQSWLQRLLGGLVAALVGLVLVPAAVVLLYWNEGRAVDAIRALNRGAAAIVEVAPDVVDTAANGKLVHVTGPARPGTRAADPIFGVSAEDALRLTRTVEMFQWKQNSQSSSSNNLGGSRTTDTTYSYEKVWSEQPISSADFKSPNGHQNPDMTVHSGGFDSANVTLGAYRLDPPVLDRLTDFKPLQVGTAPPVGWRAAGAGFYRGGDPDQPRIGDMRVSFKYIQGQTISVAAALAAGVLTTFHDQNGYQIALAQPGAVPAATMFQEEKASESTLTWILRAVGFVLVLVGFLCLTRPLVMLAAIIPFLESIVGAGAFLAALVLAIPVALVTIAVAWIAHRPVVGIVLLVGAAAVLLLARKLPARAAKPARA